MWITRDMLESPAWRALSDNGRRLIDRVMLEHMAHGGTENGNLPVTYADLVAAGIRRNSIAPAIAEVEALGWIVIQRGRAAHIAGSGHAHRYGLTWLPGGDGEPAHNGWRRLKTAADAFETARQARLLGTDGRYRAKRGSSKI